LNIGDQNCYVDQDKRIVNMSWISPDTRAISKGETLFYMPASDIQGQKLSFNKGAFRNEVYYTDRVPVRVDIVMMDGPQTADPGLAANSGLELTSDPFVTQRSSGITGSEDTEPFFAPNPMVEGGLLYFRLSDSQEVNFEVFSADQKIVVSRNIEAIRGLNKITVSSNELGLPGVYLYRLTVGERTFAGKIISVN